LLRVQVLLFLPVGAVVTVLQVEIDAAVATVPGDGIERRGVALAQNIKVATIERRLSNRPAGVFPLGTRGGHAAAKDATRQGVGRQQALQGLADEVLIQAIRDQSDAAILDVNFSPVRKLAKKYFICQKYANISKIANTSS
jgi:hypothetical protein